MPLIGRRIFVASAATPVIAALAGIARAHGDEAHAPPGGPVRREQKDWGIAGEAAAVRRSVDVRMGDDMRFKPDQIVVRRGETLRFRVHNVGALMHEFVIGTTAENEKHAALMARFPDMQHDEPYMAHVPPGRVGELVWNFNRAGRFEFACLIPGHHQAGMVGRIDVQAS